MAENSIQNTDSFGIFYDSFNPDLVSHLCRQ